MAKEKQKGRKESSRGRKDTNLTVSSPPVTWHCQLMRVPTRPEQPSLTHQARWAALCVLWVSARGWLTHLTATWNMLIFSLTCSFGPGLPGNSVQFWFPLWRPSHPIYSNWKFLSTSFQKTTCTFLTLTTNCILVLRMSFPTSLLGSERKGLSFKIQDSTWYRAPSVASACR